MSDAEGGSVNRHGGTADMESNADERARERAEAVEAMGVELFDENSGSFGVAECPECGEFMADANAPKVAHLRDCELLRARAENEADAAERAK